MTTTMAAEPEQPTIPRVLHRLRRTYRQHGWTIWHGEATGQYWAAHTGSMVLLCGDSETELAEAISRFRPLPRPNTVPAPRRPPLHLPPRPRPRGA
ncbi:hypothetical protein HDA32_003442 [Spinactinospora alkalitolerans]|uniref:DUF5678 domain-containing protein n=1 Tax=Spinactinospora alkalitolerans TaxID=687207 RepID=A0A852TZ74_9ACTN|nr:hypothetical protein [Spinactinospora alkalitolerans]NYE48322.1 hypothetical protein [Spinactinospora alkalitolerans]